MKNKLYTKGQVRQFPTLYSKDSSIEIGTEVQGKPIRSDTIVNLGAATAFLWDIKVPLLTNQSIVLGGYDDSERNEFIRLRFGAGVKNVLVLMDVQKVEPKSKYII